jgi:CheY-like chemotaxis protein
MTHPSEGNSCRVMVVDDDATGLLLAHEVIKMFGACPVPESSSLQALKDIEQRPVDLIFMDVHIQKMSGLELTKAIRTLEQKLGRPRTPIIALTASAMLHEQAECLQHGMDDVLLKPLDFAALKSALDRWCPS